MIRLVAWLVVLPALLAVAGCGGGGGAAVDGDLTAGVWEAEAGPETFYWELWRTGDGYGGVIHTVRDGRKETELPIDRVRWDSPHLVLGMDATGTEYRGAVDFGRGRIDGHVHYGGEEGPAMALRLVDPAGVPCLRARPAGEVYAYTPPPAMDDGWTTADCADAGLPREAVAGMVDAIAAGDAGVIHSLLVVAGGRLVVEEYFHGYERDHVHRLASVTKSVSSLLVGVAVDRGEIDGVDTPVLDFFGDLRCSDEPGWRAETLHHLLTMSMGLDWEPGDGPHGTGPSFFQAVLDRRVVHEPGTHWAYHSANVNLLAGVLKEATGLHADEFAAAHLFAPLDITAYDWSYRATDGYRLMDGSLQLRPRDMAKLGLLLRDEGRWRSEQVVSADWIRRSVTPHIDTSGPERYGYLWWLGEAPERDGPQPVVFANGHGSQFIAWLPERDVILVVTGGNEDNGKHFGVMGVLRGVLQG